jgi:hypothetical protein
MGHCFDVFFYVLGVVMDSQEYHTIYRDDSLVGVVFGPGSAFVGVFAWREGVLNTGADEDGTMKVRGRQS